MHPDGSVEILYFPIKTRHSLEFLGRRCCYWSCWLELLLSPTWWQSGGARLLSSSDKGTEGGSRAVAGWSSCSVGWLYSPAAAAVLAELLSTGNWSRSDQRLLVLALLFRRRRRKKGEGEKERRPAAAGCPRRHCCRVAVGTHRKRDKGGGRRDFTGWRRRSLLVTGR
uniref:Uncharacterized protein n=1 Tax=Solanum tuberosum TaxID=4113 RepID=M1D6C5_SOLTU